MDKVIHDITQKPINALQKATGGMVALLGAALLLNHATSDIAPAVQGMLANASQAGVLKASAVAGAATGLGGLAVLVLKKIDQEGLGVFMAISAGMMAAAALFSLFIPAMVSSPSVGWVLGATAAGFALMALMDQALPHEHPVPQEAQAGKENISTSTRRTAMLMTVAIALHNLPEGFAVGATPAGAAAGTAMSIGLQNVPEGMIVATALWAAGIGKIWSAVIALLTGLVEPIGAAMGIATASHWEMGSGVAMGLAAGAMAFVVAHEIWPEAKARMSNLSPLRVTMASGGTTAVVLQWLAS